MRRLLFVALCAVSFGVGAASASRLAIGKNLKITEPGLPGGVLTVNIDDGTGDFLNRVKQVDIIPLVDGSNRAIITVDSVKVDLTSLPVTIQ